MIQIIRIKNKELKKTIQLKVGEEKVFVWILSQGKKRNISVDFGLARGAKLENIFLFTASGKAEYNIKVRVAHKGSDSESKNVIRGSLAGESCAEVLGETVVEKKAKNTSSWLEEKILLFGKSRTRADPRLEIKTSNVKKAGHEATVSRMRADELFYMSSRGISESEAIKLKSEGFLAAPLLRAGLNNKDAINIISSPLK